MPGLEERVSTLEGQVKDLEEKVENQRVFINEVNENVVKLVDGAIQTGFKLQELEQRIVVLEAR